MQQTRVLIVDDEKNIRRAGILNDIKHFTDGTSALSMTRPTIDE